MAAEPGSGQLWSLAYPILVMSAFAEHDWRYLRSIKGAMLEDLSHRTNDEIRATLANERLSENEKRRRVYGIVLGGDEVVARCFDDWRRSTIFERCLALRRHGLLTDQRLEGLNPEARAEIVSIARA